MRTTHTAILVALALAACTNRDRYEPELGPAVRMDVSEARRTELFAAPADRDGVLFARGGKIVRADGRVVSEHWRGPVDIVVDQRNRVWAIDAGDKNERPRIARGRERDRANRNRHASFLPEGSRPVAAAADDTEIYVCDAATNSVLRFHVGIDDVPRRRGPLKGVKCRHDIAVLDDGSIVTATDDAILRYPRR